MEAAKGLDDSSYLAVVFKGGAADVFTNELLLPNVRLLGAEDAGVINGADCAALGSNGGFDAVGFAKNDCC